MKTGILLLTLATMTACSEADGANEAPRPLLDEASPGGQEAGDEVAPGESGSQVEIRVAGHAVQVEIADTPAKRERGLMFRDSVPENQGMLFVYETQRTLSFWMKNTPIALDIAFVDADGRIVDIQQMQPNTDDLHVSKSAAMYALEMRLGWFEDHEVEIGARVEF